MALKLEIAGERSEAYFQLPKLIFNCCHEKSFMHDFSRVPGEEEWRTKKIESIAPAVTCVGRKKGGRFEIFNQESNRSPRRNMKMKVGTV